MKSIVTWVRDLLASMDAMTVLVVCLGLSALAVLIAATLFV